MVNRKERLFKLTQKDFNFIWTRGRGKGGQKKNKTESACICQHLPSGAEGYAEDSRSREQNKQLAFERLTSSNLFKAWLTIKTDAYLEKIDITEQDSNGTISTRKLRGDEV